LKIVADDKIPFLRGALEQYGEVIYLPGREITRDVIADADAMLIRTRTKCNEQLLRGTKVRFIGTATIGFDHIDTLYCEMNNIRWTNAPGCNSSSVQQYIAAAMLTVASEYGFTLKEKTLGIIGVGNVGSKVAKLAEIMGMKVVLNDPPRAMREGAGAFVNFDRLLMEADIITVHVPLTMEGEDQTFHLFDSCTFSKMKNSAIFINTSRGEVVDNDAISHVLESSGLRGAVIDVWEDEPYIDKELLSKVFLATPHIAGYSADGKANGAAMVVNALMSFFSLPVKSWYPENVPEPPESEIFINGTARNDQDIIEEVVLHTYQIREDDRKFRLSPSGFEKQRGDYPLRREFPSFSVHLVNSSGNVRLILERMGFHVRV